jgi:hypothetical protein
VTVADALAFPLGPLQLRLKVLLLVKGPVDWLPEVALAPDHAPEAEQEVTLVEDQVSVEDPPLETFMGAATSDTVGDVLDTVTVADALLLPPGPEQVRE